MIVFINIAAYIGYSLESFLAFFLGAGLRRPTAEVAICCQGDLLAALVVLVVVPLILVGV